MDTHPQSARSRSDTLRDDAGILLAMLADIAGVALWDAGKRLIAMLRNGTTELAQAKATVVGGAKATGRAVRQHPYLTIVLAMAIGIILGVLYAFRRRAKAH
jgi:ElaB/YqjD/DUF883 family membrane-anchored ribosome-binding protein